MTWNFYYDREAENHFIADENGKTVAMVHQEDQGEMLASAPGMKAEIARLTAERDQALATNERWRRNSTETWEAMTAMRNEINQHIPMPSIESDLLQGPENSIFCASVAEAVISGIQARTAAAAMEMRERAAGYAWNKRDLLADAEKKQIDAGLTGREYHGRRLEAELLSRTIRALPIDPDAQKALDKMLAKAREDALREAAKLAASGHHPRAILALLNEGGQP